MRRFVRAAIASVVLACSFALICGPSTAHAAPNGQICAVDDPRITPTNNNADEGAQVKLVVHASGATQWSWAQVSGPAVTLSGADTDSVIFTAPQVGSEGATVVLGVTVKGCDPVQTRYATKAINVQNVSSTNTAPTAVAALSPSTVYEGQSFGLDASGSTDPENDLLTYAWTQVDSGSFPIVGLPSSEKSLALVAPTGVPYPGGVSITVRLTVTDRAGLTSETDQVLTVRWLNDPPVAVAKVEHGGTLFACETGSTTVAMNEGASFTLDGFASTNDEDVIASYLWTQTLAGPVLVLPVAPTTPSLSLYAPSLKMGNGDTMEFQLRVTDAGGLSSMSQKCTVQVLDVTAPELVIPDGKYAEATSADGAVVTFDASAVDAFEGPVSATCTPPSGAVFPLGSTSVECTASDTAGNTATKSFQVSVVDTTPPDITVPEDITAEATSAAGAVVTYTASATDLVDGPVEVTCTPASGSTFGLGLHTVECNASDARGNAAATKTFTVKVQDTTAPALTVPGTQTAEATGPTGAAVSFSVTATDAVDSGPVVHCSPASGSTFALGTTTVSCTATDKSGNTSPAKTFDVQVVDTTPPALTLPSPITAEATSAAGAVVTYIASASDLVDGVVAVSCTPASGATFALASTEVTCSATDKAGNTANGAFTVTVRDTTPPTVSVPSDITTGPTTASGAAVTYTASATDLVDGALAATCTPKSGAAFAPGTTTVVTCSSTDAHGNTGSASFRVTVRPFTFLGFFQPVDNLPAVNTVKGGATVPLKWKLQGEGGVEITDVKAVASVKAGAVPCSFATELDTPLDATTTGGTVLRYDGVAMQYVFNWQTPKQPGTCWRVEVAFADGSQARSANFKLK